MIWKILLTLCIICITGANSSRCKESGDFVCCPGFRFNKSTNTCEECPIGFYYWGCARKCRYPTYGKDCQEDCDCDERLCNFSVGCIETHNHALFKPMVSHQTDEKPVHTFYHDEERSTVFFKVFTKGGYRSESKTKTESSSPYLDTAEHQKNFLPTHILYIISGLIAVFVIFFGIYLFFTVYRYCTTKRVTISKSDVEGTKEELGYFQLNRTPQEQLAVVQEERLENSSNNSMYLSPTYHAALYNPHHEDINIYDLPSDCFSMEHIQGSHECFEYEEPSKQTEEQAYLTPIIDRHDEQAYLSPIIDRHNYIEIVG